MASFTRGVRPGALRGASSRGRTEYNWTMLPALGSEPDRRCPH